MNSTLASHSPIAEPVREVLHGIQVDDPFRWLEDQYSPATRSFIRAEQETYREYLDRHKELRSQIERRVTELLTHADVDLPVSDHHGGLIYLKREAEDEQRAIFHQDRAGAECLLISAAILRRDSYTSLAILQVSPNGRFLVFGVRTAGEDIQEIGIYDLQERKVLLDRLPAGFYRGLVFASNQSGFYYAHEDAAGAYQNRRAVRWHEFGNDPSNDCEIFYAGDGPALRLVVQEAEDASALGYHVVTLESVPRTRFLMHEFPLSNPPREIIELSGESFRPLFTARAIEACTTHVAPLGRIVHVSLERPDIEAWTDIVPEKEEVLTGWERCGNLSVLHYKAGSRTLTRIYSQSGNLIRTITYPAFGTVSLGQVDECAKRLFYAHSDVTEPPAIHCVDLMTGERHLWWRQSSSIRCEAIEVESAVYPSKDGTEIPITLLHPRGVRGVRPVLLSAYGGGGVSTTPKFSVMLTILSEAGFTCAIAHVRGGGEGGLEWHFAAQKQRKQTSVDDLLCAAEWMVANGYATAEHLGIGGQSNGALVALCALTQHPEMFRAVLALGPIADLTRFHLFGVARGFVAELGSPENPDDFAALYRLSPYHHIQRDVNYPAVLIISGDRDKRCDALHARKMIARLRNAVPKGHPILLDYTGTRGHKPVLPLTERIRALADRLTFLIAELVFKPLVRDM
jgi:prolyl oligopeptidase